MVNKIFTKKLVVVFVGIMLLSVFSLIGCNKVDNNQANSNEDDPPAVSVSTQYKLQQAYDYAECRSPWAELAYDKSYIELDTNPYNYDSDYSSSTRYVSDVRSAIVKINSYLGLPSSLINSMSSTRAIDGRQSRTFSDKHITVEWSYHPDHGLEILYYIS